MILGRFIGDSEHAGREVLLEDHLVSIEGVGPAEFAVVADADARGEIEWESSAFRTWTLNRAADDGWTAPAIVAPAEEPAPAPVAEAADTAPAKAKPKRRAAAAADEPTPDTAAAVDSAVAAVAAALDRQPAKKEEPPAKPKRRAKKAEPAPEPVVAAKAKPRPKPAPAAAPAPAEEKPEREPRKPMSPRARVVFGVIATLVFAAMMAVALSRPIEKRPLPTPAIGTTAAEEPAGE